MGAFMENNKKTTLRTIVRDYVISRIIDGEFTSGMKINESKICQDLGLSKSPVREAILELVSEGILNSEDFKGTSVNSFEPEDMLELATMRSVLEVMAVDFATPHINEEARAKMLEVTDRMKVVAESGDVKTFAKLDMELHYQIILLSNNKTLIETWQRIYNKLLIHIFRKNALYGDLGHQYKDHVRLISLFNINSLYLFKQMLTEHLYYYLK
jgi:DNA-binding GntR family transcriptional regulator